MNKRFIYISIIFISIASSILFFSIKHFNQQSIVENKVISYLSSDARRLIQFKNPDELYNKYFTQNMILKKIQSKEKLQFVRVLQELDSLYHLATSQSIQIQDYSFYLGIYSMNDWLLGFSAQQVQDISKIKKILHALNYPYKEIDGNFFIASHSSGLQKIGVSPSSTKSRMKEWMMLFSKHPTPLHVYQKQDTIELAYQVVFEPRKMFINGYVNYKNVSSKNVHSTKMTDIPGFSNVLYCSIKPSQINTIDISAENEYVNDVLRSIKNTVLPKQIELKEGNIFPFQNFETMYEAAQSVADSVFQKEDIYVFRLKKEYSPDIAQVLNYKADSILYLALSEYNLAITNDTNFITQNKNVLLHNFSNASYYFVLQNNVPSLYIENTGYSAYLPIALQIQKDTSLYNFYSEIFSSNADYFSFVMSIERSISNTGYLWTYQHNTSIQKIAGIFDDHKTRLQFILIQDSLNNLVAINANGEKLWSYPLESPIQSEIFNVDMLKNNKHQILFNTHHKIYLIDRNGQNVGRFPLQFVSAMTNPIGVFDYENKKNYRIWFSTRNYYTYNYTMDGKLADSYRPYYLNEVVSQAPYYASIGLSDYIVLITTKGRIIGISRKGEGRFALSHTLPDNTLDYYFDIGNTLANSYLYYCSKDGLKRISFSNELKDIIDFENQDVVDAKFTNHTFDKSVQLATLSSHQFILYSLKGEQLYSYSLDTNYTELRLQHSNTNIYFILRYADYYTIIQQSIDSDRRIIVQNLNSTTWPFITNIFKDDKDYLIYTKKDKVVCKKITS